MKLDDLNLAAERYDSGYSLNEVARIFGIPRATLRENFVKLGVEIRLNGYPSEEEQAARRRPRTCACGSPTSTPTSYACVPCTLCPPCTCGTRQGPVRRYGKEWLCRCGRLRRER